MNSKLYILAYYSFWLLFTLLFGYLLFRVAEFIVNLLLVISILIGEWLVL